MVKNLVDTPIFTTKDLAKLLDNCIDDLEDGGSKLFGLAELFHSISEATGESFYDAFVPLLGVLAGEIMSCRPFASLPILPEEIRKKFQSSFGEAVKGSKDALKILKTELCVKGTKNPSKILDALSLLGKHYYILGVLRSTLVKSPSANPGD